MGGHGPEIPKVPDWRIYRIEDVPQLVKLEKTLKCYGLKDPWLRNEVWRYTRYINKYPPVKTAAKYIFSGFKYGLIAAIITTAAEYAYFSSHYGEDHGDHH